MSANRPASLGAAAARPIRQPVQLNWSRLTTIAVVLIAVGIIGAGAGLAVGDPRQVWLTWLVDLLFFVGIAQAVVVASAAFYLRSEKYREEKYKIQKIKN